MDAHENLVVEFSSESESITVAKDDMKDVYQRIAKIYNDRINKRIVKASKIRKALSMMESMMIGKSPNDIVVFRRRSCAKCGAEMGWSEVCK